MDAYNNRELVYYAQKHIDNAIFDYNIATENVQKGAPGTFTDSRNNKTYKMVKIGAQTWMAKNLAYKVSSGCWAYDDDQRYATIFGYLYDWNTAKHICPSGWHLPSDEEWTILTTYLGGESVAGCRLKETGTTYWHSPNIGATNESGFAAVAAGTRSGNGKSNDIGNFGNFWSSTEGNYFCAWGRYLDKSDGSVFRSNLDKSNGFSVRCVRDF